MRRLPPTSDEPWAPRETRSPPQDSEVRRLLSEEGEQEALAVLREQFRHEQRITSDDVRFVVRSIASHNGSVALPPDFPPTRWILDFKRAYGFAQLGPGFAFGLPERIQASRSSSIARVTGSSSNSSSNRNGSSDDEQDRDNLGRRYSAEEPDGFSRYALRSSYDSDSQLQMQHTRRQQHQQQLQHQRRSMVVDNHRAAAAWQSERGRDREELGSNSSNNSMDSESGTTTGASSSSSVGVGAAPSSNNNHNSAKQHDAQDDSPAANEKRGYKLSHTVPPETWEKAIAAVEQQGMSLRAAAKIYGVHFAALHRRVKKRAQGGQSSKGNGGYFHPSDEAGIMRVVVARAELGVLMTFDELMKLVETAALRKLPDISVDAARKLMVRFQSRNEQSIRHIIVDWPSPLPAVTTPSGTSQPQHYHLEHPGFDYQEAPSDGHLQRPFGPPRSSGLAGGAATAAAVAAAPPSLFQPPSRVGPFSPGSRAVLPSMKPVGDALPAPPSLPQQRLVAAGARAARDKDRGRAPVMFV